MGNTVINAGASVTWYCSCIHCACIAPVPSAGGVCSNCACGNHH